MLRSVLVVVVVALAACKSEKAPPPPATKPAPTPPAVKPDTAGATLEAHLGGTPDARPELPLTIEAVHDGEQPLDKPPWHGPGGNWTFLDLRTPGGATFTAGFGGRKELEGESFVLYDVMLVGLDRQQGAAVVTELARALGVKPAAPGAAKTLSPLRASSVVLGENVQRADDGSFGGAGTWSASKWTFETEDHSEEIFFNYSLADKQAVLSPKDEDYNADIVADFAVALRDGR